MERFNNEKGDNMTDRPDDMGSYDPKLDASLRPPATPSELAKTIDDAIAAKRKKPKSGQNYHRPATRGHIESYDRMTGEKSRRVE